MIKPTHPFHHHCLLCSSNNPLSLGLTYYVEENCLCADLYCDDKLQGYGGIIHGGVIAAIQDAVMVNYLLYQDVTAYTAELNVRYKQQIKINQYLHLRARLEQHKGRLYTLKSEVLVNQQIMAYASGKFIQSN